MNCKDWLIQEKKRHDYAHDKVYRRNLKLRLHQHLGSKCTYCGITVYELLEIHHKNGHGKQERRERFLNNYNAYINYYVRHPQEAIDRLELTCANCHRMKTYSK